MKTFSALQSQGTSNKALPTVYVRSRRIRWKRAKRRAFFLLESGETSTKRTKLIRYLVILVMLLSLAGVIFETMVVEFDSATNTRVVRDLGMASELLGALVLLIDTVFRIWACTVDSRLPKGMFIIPHVFKTPERWCCSLAWQDPADLVKVDDTGKPIDAAVGFRDDRPRPCGCKCRARVVYLFRPWSILELLTFIPIIIWITSAGSTDIFALSQYGHGLRMLRLVRVVVLRRMFPGMRLLFKVIASKARELTSAFVMAVIVAVVLGAVVYELERPRAERTGFRTLFDGAYWSTITLSTVGYGDIVPLRFAGRVVTGVAIALLVGVFTLPAGVISSGFVELTDKTRVARRNAVIKFERVFRRLQGRSLMRRWHANTDASHGSRLARTHSAKVLRFRSSMRRIHIGAGLDGGDGGGDASEVTLANLLGDAGYATAAIGKWHLGTDEFHPVNRGFQQYRGILSTQNECVSNIRFPGSAIPGHTSFGPCPYFVNGTIAAQGDVDVLNIDTPYNEFASSFIKENAANDKPFFLYFGSHHTHAPQFAGDDLLNATARGLFGDSQAEFDRSVGVLIQAVKAAGIADSTAIFVSADNGPSKHWFQLGGSAGQYKCGKGTTYEGGLRVPTVFWAPGVVQNPGGSAEALTAMVDFFPTILGWAGVAKPSNLTIDGVDISSVLSSPLLPPPGRQQQKRREQTVTTNAEGATGPYDPYGPYLPPAQTGPREAVYMWRGNTLMAVRAGNFKAHWWTRGWVGDQFSFPQNPECYADLVQHDPPLLFDVANDAAEFYPLNATDPSYAPIVAQLTQLKLKQEADVVLAPSQTDLGSNADRFPCCNPTCTPRPFCCKCE